MLVEKTHKTFDELEKVNEKILEDIKSVEGKQKELVANTLDFQKSSVSLLQKENTLTSVVREIEKYMSFYKNFEECSRVLSHTKTL